MPHKKQAKASTSRGSGKEAAKGGRSAISQQSTIGVCVHAHDRSCGALAAPRDLVGATRSHFSPLIGPSAAHEGLENRQDAVVWDTEGLRSSDQRIKHVGMDHGRSDVERMRGFAALLPQKCSFDACGRLNAYEASEKLVQVFG